MAHVEPMTDGLTNGRVKQGESSVVLFYLGILRRRIWVILPVLIISGAIGLIKGYQTLPVYRATAQILVERHAGITVASAERRAAEYLSDEFFSTQRELLLSKSVMDIALRSPVLKRQFDPGASDAAGKISFLDEIKDTVFAALNVAPSSQLEIWERLRRSLDASHNEDGAFLYLHAQSSSPSRAARRANIVAHAFKTYNEESRMGKMSDGLRTLNEEKTREELSLREAENALATFRRNTGSLMIGDDGASEPMRERLALINDELAKTEISRITLQSQISIMREALGSDAPTSTEIDRQLRSIPDIQVNTQLAGAREDLANAEKEFYRLAEFYGSSHPLMKEAETTVSRFRQIFRETLEEITSAHEKRLAGLVDTEKELSAKYEEVKAGVVASENEQFVYQRLLGEVNRHKRLLDMIIDRTRELDSKTGIDRVNVDVVEEASIPKVPINASKLETTLFAMILGLFLGVGLAFLFENLDDSIKTPEDLTDRLDIPFLGFVPSVEDADASSTGPKNRTRPGKSSPAERVATTYGDFFKVIKRRIGAESETMQGVDLNKKEDLTARQRTGAVVVNQPMSSIAEAYRSIRANLFYSTPAEELKLLAITSSRPQEGKTTTSTNLALSIAQTGKRVLLIDADLHRPSVHKNLDAEFGRGLTDVLTGSITWREATRKLSFEQVNLETLDLITAGPSTPNPSELLNSNRMREVLTQVRSEYDWVLIDTPPVLFVSDASIISVMCDGVILVVKSGDSSRSLLSRTMERLSSVHAHMVGSILNNVQVSRVGRHYSSYYNVGYSRYSQDYQRTYYAREGADEAPSSPTRASPRIGTKSSSEEAPDAPTAQLYVLRLEKEDLQKKLNRQAEASAAREKAIEKELAELRDQISKSAEGSVSKVETNTELQALQAELENAKASMATMQSELESNRKGNTQAEGKLDSLVADLQTQVSTARGALKAEQSKTESLESRVAEIEKQFKERQHKLNGALAEKEAELKKTRERVEERERDLASRDKWLEQEKQRFEKSTRELRFSLKEEQQRNWLETSTEIDALEKKLEVAERRLGDAVSSLNAARREAQEAVAQAAKQKKEAEDTLAQQATKLMAAAQECQKHLSRIQELEAQTQTPPHAEQSSANDAKPEKQETPQGDHVAAKEDPPRADAPAAAPATKPGQDSNEHTIPPAAPEINTAQVASVANAPGELPQSKKAYARASEQTRAHMAAGYLEKAEMLAQSLVAVQAGDVHAWELLVMSQFKSGNQPGLKHSIDLLADRSDLSHVHALACGQLSVMNNELPRARAYFEKALAKTRKSAGALEALTRLDFQQANTDTAAIHTKEFIKRFPKDPYGHYASATLHILAGNTRKAETILRKSIKLRKTAEALNDLAWLLNARGEYTIAERTAREALDMNRELPQLWDTLGTTQMNAGNFDDARVSFEKAATLAPDDIGALLALVELHARKGDFPKARELNKRLMGLSEKLTRAEQAKLKALRDQIEKA